jgi:hypothetical protein
VIGPPRLQGFAQKRPLRKNPLRIDGQIGSKIGIVGDGKFVGEVLKSFNIGRILHMLTPMRFLWVLSIAGKVLVGLEIFDMRF